MGFFIALHLLNQIFLSYFLHELFSYSYGLTECFLSFDVGFIGYLGLVCPLLIVCHNSVINHC